MGFLNLFKKKKDRRADLVARFFAMLTARYPGATMTPSDAFYFRLEGGGIRECSVSLENLVRQTEGLGEDDVEAQLQRYFYALVEALDDANQPVYPEQIIPLIKDDQYIVASVGKAELVKEHLAADLWVVYGIDFPTKTSSLKPETLAELGIERDRLRPLALENLRRILPSAEKHGDGEWFLVTAGTNYTASLLLFDELWSELAGHVAGQLVAAVPSRDVLLVTGSNSASGIATVREQALAVEKSGSYAISQTLLLRQDDRWVALP